MSNFDSNKHVDTFKKKSCCLCMLAQKYGVEQSLLTFCVFSPKYSSEIEIEANKYQAVFPFITLILL